MFIWSSGQKYTRSILTDVLMITFQFINISALLNEIWTGNLRRVRRRTKSATNWGSKQRRITKKCLFPPPPPTAEEDEVMLISSTSHPLQDPYVINGWSLNFSIYILPNPSISQSSPLPVSHLNQHFVLKYASRFWLV